MNDPMSLDSQTTHIEAAFRKLLMNPTLPVYVLFTDGEEIIVSHQRPFGGGPNLWWLMEIPSDDDGFYRFELWLDGRDTNHWVKFPYPETVS